MATWVAEIVTAVFICEADNFEEAEAKYDAYWDGDEEAGEYNDTDTQHNWSTE